jgi:hypothetical protein
MRNAALRLLVVGLVFLLGASAAQAATVILDPGDSSKAIGIDNLDIDGALFDVDFTDQQSAASTYGPFPGDLFLFLPLDGKAEAIADTMDLINFELNLEGGILGVGTDTFRPDPPDGYNNYFMGWQTQLTLPGGVAEIKAWDSGQDSAIWTKNHSSTFGYNDDGSTAWAVVTPVPEPGTALLLGLGLAGLGVAGRSRRDESKATT